MRLKSTLFAILFIVFQSHATSSVSGIAVAARWTGAYDFQWGYDWQWYTGCKIIKYVITSGVTADTSVLYNGPAEWATLNPDGQRMAFVRPSGAVSSYNAVISVMNVSGGTPVDAVTGLVNGFQGFFLDWPTGDWIFYGKSSSGSGGFDEMWKANVTTKENVKVCTFTNGNHGWQSSVSNDGLKACVRLLDGPACGGYQTMYRFAFSDFSGGNIAFDVNDSNMFGGGCGSAISPDGGYLMHLISASHDLFQFQNWNKSIICSLSVGTMASWGTFFGMGTNTNRWSCNDYKWIVLQCGLEDRQSRAGSNQCLINWVDHEQVRTSNAVAVDLTNVDAWRTAEQNETGDFWVGTPSPPPAKVATPTITSSSGTGFKDSTRVSLACATAGAAIYYTINGSTPDSTKALYSAAFKLTATTTVKARAYKSGSVKSDSAMATFTKATTAALPSIAGATRAENSTITVFDILGRQTATSVGQNSRNNGIFWDGAALHGISLARGVYFVQLRSGKTVQTLKLTVQK